MAGCTRSSPDAHGNERETAGNGQGNEERVFAVLRFHRFVGNSVDSQGFKCGKPPSFLVSLPIGRKWETKRNERETAGNETPTSVTAHMGDDTANPMQTLCAAGVVMPAP